MTTLSLLAIGVSLTLGYYLYMNFSDGANAAYDAVAAASSALWVLAGIFAILGGFVIFGSLIVILFSYTGLTKGKATEKRLRSRIAG